MEWDEPPSINWEGMSDKSVVVWLRCHIWDSGNLLDITNREFPQPYLSFLASSYEVGATHVRRFVLKLLRTDRMISTPSVWSSYQCSLFGLLDMDILFLWSKNCGGRVCEWTGWYKTVSWRLTFLSVFELLSWYMNRILRWNVFE